MPAEQPTNAAQAQQKKGKEKAKRQSSITGVARAYIHSSFNNTIVSIANERGDVVSWSSAGACGFKGTKKGTPYAAQVASDQAVKKALDMGVKTVQVFIKGPGPGREVAIRTLQTAGLKIISIKDVTPLPHNGCRPPKARRV